MTGSRVQLFLLVSDRGALAVATAGRLSPSETHTPRIALRLTFDETVTGSLGPSHDVFILIVEDELALVGFDGQHRVAFAFFIAHTP